MQGRERQLQGTRWRHQAHLISLWTVELLQCGQNFFSSSRSVVLRVSAKNETWLQVIRPDGTVLMDRLLQTGDVVDMGSAPPYTLVLGRASAAQVFVRGQAIPLAPHTRGDVARYEVK